MFIGLCGSWDNNQNNDGGRQTVEKWRKNRENSLFFYKAKGGDVCLPKDLLCNKKFTALPGWINYVFPGIFFTNISLTRDNAEMFFSLFYTEMLKESLKETENKIE